MKKSVVMMAAMLLMAGGTAVAQQPETKEPAKQETPAQPAKDEAEPAKDEAEPAKEEKAEEDGACKGESTQGECGQASSSASGTTDAAK